MTLLVKLAAWACLTLSGLLTVSGPFMIGRKKPEPTYTVGWYVTGLLEAALTTVLAIYALRRP